MALVLKPVLRLSCYPSIFYGRCQNFKAQLLLWASRRRETFQICLYDILGPSTVRTRSYAAMVSAALSR